PSSLKKKKVTLISASVSTMKNVSDVAAVAIGESFRSRRPLPKRGQIKSRMAAYAFYSIVSVLSKASLHHQQSSGKNYLRETKDTRNH
ncbi:hypothetical protein U1Q18_050887, partial [Sarracenia purpurea var. burkii]